MMNNNESLDINVLVEENINLVHYCCHKMKVRSNDYDDLFQTGCLGLVKAAKKFDFSRGVAFSTYAVPVIFGEIKRVFRDDSTVKMSRSLKTLAQKIMMLNQSMSSKLGREPTISELAAELSVDCEQVAEALCASQSIISLTMDGEDGENQFDIPVDGHEENICNRLALSEIISGLPDCEQNLIKLRYFQHKTQTQTADDLGLTQVQVSRLEKKIITEIKGKLTG